jgi:signal transduction histidine kinase
MSVAFAFSGNPVFSELVPVLNVVAGFVIYMLLEAYKNFAKIVRTTEARLLAERANLAKSRFLSVISHELRTPLNAIIGYSEMLEESAQAGGRKNDAADLGRIGGAAHHLLKLINEVLDFSKIEAGAESVELGVVDVTAKAHAVADMIKPIMAANRVRLVVDVADLGSSYTDGFKLSQCLLNLLSNAAKFSSDGVVSFAARRIQTPAGDALEFTVSDTGVGIAPEVLTTLFAPFVQADASITRRFGGTGLGLAITRQLARLLGGNVSVQSQVGKGSVFTLCIPAQYPQTSLNEAA